MIDILNLSVQFSDIKITFPNLRIKPYSITIVEGDNGYGKTTLLKAIANLIEYDGVITKKNTTFVSQKPVMFNISVYDNIIYPLVIRKVDITDYKEKIEELIKLFGLENVRHKNAKKCSSGEQMKTSIIRAIIFKPEVLILDEPTTALDLKSRETLSNLLQNLKKEMTVIVSSHDRYFIDQVKDDLVILGDPHV